jgi:hypothetical protein
MAGFTPTTPVAVASAASYQFTNLQRLFDASGNTTTYLTTFSALDASGNLIPNGSVTISSTPAQFAAALGVGAGVVDQKLHAALKAFLGVAGTAT